MSEGVMEEALNVSKSVAGIRPVSHLSAGARLKRRRRSELIFRAWGVGAIVVSIAALVALLTSIVASGWPALFEPVVRLGVRFDPEILDPDGHRTSEALAGADYRALVRANLKAAFPEVSGRRERRELAALVSNGAPYHLRDLLLEDPSLLGRTVEVDLLLADEASVWAKGGVDTTAVEAERLLSDQQLAWLGVLREQGRITTRFNRTFFTAADSREPEMAGILGAFVGSLLTIAVTLLCCFPVGVGAAVYLEEFARRGRLSDFIEVNINNLAAVPSVVFGLLGLAVFLNVFHLPRSAPIVGGLVLSLMTLPTIIIAARTALKSIPPSIREAAMAVGASPVQVVAHHLLPLATPGIMTGTIVGMARALGETAPLLMIGMVAFVADTPESFTSPATVLPVQIFLWADAPERSFEERTSAAILVLLAFLIVMNLGAILIRRRFERRW
jgi:phosphate transport system permease protein